MARVEKDGSLRGAIGNLVFVKNGNTTYARMKPTHLKQTPKTQAAAKYFGLVSVQEKQLRQFMLSGLEFPAMQYFAARHRARLQRTLVAKSENIRVFGQPEALMGFDFNPNLPWEKAANFFPQTETQEDGKVLVRLSDLRWAAEITPPKGSTAAQLTFFAFQVDLNQMPLAAEELAKLTLEIAPHQAAEAQTLTFPALPKGKWLLLVGGLKFTRPHTAPAEACAGTYLFGG